MIALFGVHSLVPLVGAVFLIGIGESENYSQKIRKEMLSSCGSHEDVSKTHQRYFQNHKKCCFTGAGLKRHGPELEKYPTLHCHNDHPFIYIALSTIVFWAPIMVAHLQHSTAF